MSHTSVWYTVCHLFNYTSTIYHVLNNQSFLNSAKKVRERTCRAWMKKFCFATLKDGSSVQGVVPFRTIPCSNSSLHGEPVLQIDEECVVCFCTKCFRRRTIFGDVLNHILHRSDETFKHEMVLYRTVSLI